MFGLKTRDDANTKSIVQLITTEYNFKNIFSLKTKQRIPANKKSTELVNGRQSSTFFSEFESVLILPEELKKNAPATATTHNDKIRTGIFKTTSIVKTTIGYIAVNE